MRTLEQAQSQFAYHPATEDTAPRHAAVRDLFGRTLVELWEQVPDGPEKTLAIRALQESQMYANLAIALTAPVDAGATRSVARVLPKEDGPKDPPDNSWAKTAPVNDPAAWKSVGTVQVSEETLKRGHL